MGIRIEFTPAGNPVKHGGSGTAYANYGCRCEECTEANTKRNLRRRHQRAHEQAPEHGKASSYTNWGCRCEPCKATWAAKTKSDYQSRVERGLAADDSRHGTLSAYTGWGCRCQNCKAASSRYHKENRAPKNA